MRGTTIILPTNQQNPDSLYSLKNGSRGVCYAKGETSENVNAGFHATAQALLLLNAVRPDVLSPKTAQPQPCQTTQNGEASYAEFLAERIQPRYHRTPKGHAYT